MIDVTQLRRLLMQTGIVCDVYSPSNTQLKQFAEASHKAMCNPLKRLSVNEIEKVFDNLPPYAEGVNFITKFANAIMDEMERINK